MPSSTKYLTVTLNWPLKNFSEIRTALATLLREESDQADDLKDVIANEQPMLTFKSRMEQTVRYFDSFRIVYQKMTPVGPPIDLEGASNAAYLFGALKEATLRD